MIILLEAKCTNPNKTGGSSLQKGLVEGVASLEDYLDNKVLNNNFSSAHDKALVSNFKYDILPCSWVPT